MRPSESALYGYLFVPLICVPEPSKATTLMVARFRWDCRETGTAPPLLVASA
jgi:hypothetical protein